MAETQPQQRVGHFAVLVKAGGHADRIREIDAGDRDRQGALRGGHVRTGRARRGHEFQAAYRQAVRAFGIQTEQKRAKKRIEHRRRHSALRGLLNVWPCTMGRKI
jgi:hypothetical protein